MNKTTIHARNSIQQLLIKAGASLEATSDSTRLDAEVLLAHALKRDRSYLYTWPEREPPAAAIAQFLESVEQRKAGVPVAYITTKKEFWSMDFRVTVDTLVPRSDTETLVQIALDRLAVKPGPVLDLGTGCGAIAISLAKECERNQRTTDTAAHAGCEVSATDNSVLALNIARENAQHLDASVSFYLSNWFSQLPERRWQLIVSNPPYLAKNDSHLAALQHEPRTALVAADNGLGDINQIIRSAKRYLRTNGTLMIEHGEQQGVAVRTLMHEAGYRCVDTETDIASRDRVTTGTNA